MASQKETRCAPARGGAVLTALPLRDQIITGASLTEEVLSMKIAQAERCSSTPYGDLSAFGCLSTENLPVKVMKYAFASEDPLTT